jgi:F-type H+/Na+-transporting ATPase subunit beta
MNEDLQLNVQLLKRRVPNLTKASQSIGLRPATVSNLTTGKTPVGKAEVRTLVALATLAGCTLDELIIRGSGTRMLETGIKVLDVFAPIVRGGTVGLVARPGMGQFVIMSELFRRVKKREYSTLLWLPEKLEPGVSDTIDEANMTCRTLDEVLAEIEKVGHDQDVMLGVEREFVLSGDVLTLKEKLQEMGVRPVTIILADMRGNAMDEDAPYGPLDTLLRFDADLVSRHIFPAIDLVYSTSTVLEGGQLEAHHLTLQQRAKKVMRRYRELRSLVAASGEQRLTDQDKETHEKGERLEAFLAQPFYVAEAFTKKPGEWLSLNDSLEGLRRILDTTEK